MPTKVNVNGATQNADKLALVIGGGYEADQDSASAHDRHHRQLDLHRRLRQTGALLWHGSRDGSAQRLQRLRAERWTTRSRRVSASSTSTATASLDRMYAGDMGGQVWRFDVSNGADGRAISSRAASSHSSAGHRLSHGARRHSAVLQRPGRRVHQHARRQLHPRRHRLRPSRPPAQHCPSRMRSMRCATTAMRPLTQGAVRRVDDHRARRSRAGDERRARPCGYGRRRLARRSQHRRLERREGARRGAHVREPGVLLDVPAEHDSRDVRAAARHQPHVCHERLQRRARS